MVPKQERAEIKRLVRLFDIWTVYYSIKIEPPNDLFRGFEPGEHLLIYTALLKL